VTAVHAQQDGRAGLVIVGEDGVVQTACVAFSEETISGYELLSRSGLEVTVDVSGAGTAVCAIEGAGCPADDCFCSCKGGGDCTYWSYWLAGDEGWQYARAGAQQVRVSAGDVQGWTWDAGSVTSAIEPPGMAFDDVCPAGEQSTVNGQQSTNNGGAPRLPFIVIGIGVVGLVLFYVRRRSG
ncbi:MAG: hypothetical protein ACE5FD_09340, partial [Anaerolineae bacterium]